MTHPRAMSGEELAEIAKRNEANQEMIGGLPGGSADWLREAFSDIAKILAHIASFSVPTSGMTEENTNDLFDAIEKAFVSATKGHDKARIVPDDLDCHMLARIASSVATSQLSQGNGRRK